MLLSEARYFADAWQLKCVKAGGITQRGEGWVVSFACFVGGCKLGLCSASRCWSCQTKIFSSSSFRGLNIDQNVVRQDMQGGLEHPRNPGWLHTMRSLAVLALFVFLLSCSPGSFGPVAALGGELGFEAHGHEALAPTGGFDVFCACWQSRLELFLVAVAAPVQNTPMNCLGPWTGFRGCAWASRYECCTATVCAGSTSNDEAVAFVADVGGDLDLYLATNHSGREGGAVVAVGAALPFSDDHVAWSNDGSAIAFISTRDLPLRSVSPAQQCSW